MYHGLSYCQPNITNTLSVCGGVAIFLTKWTKPPNTGTAWGSCIKTRPFPLLNWGSESSLNEWFYTSSWYETQQWRTTTVATHVGECRYQWHNLPLHYSDHIHFNSVHRCTCMYSASNEYTHIYNTLALQAGMPLWQLRAKRALLQACVWWREEKGATTLTTAHIAHNILCL